MTTDFKIFGAFNALRRPSEATKTSVGPKYDKMDISGLSDHI